MGGNHVYVKDTRDASQPLVLHEMFCGNLPFLVESNTFSNSAFLTKSTPNAFTEPKSSTSLIVLSTSLSTYSHWHRASGYIDTFVWNKSFYENDEILLNFIKYNYQPYLLLNSVYHLPEPSLTKTIKHLEHIFLDLSGKAPILSLGGSFHYITFIDNFICFAWIYFLKEKLQVVAAIKDFINIVEN